jgi:16S rRNA (uracil1498-N3)-methyltransferase
MRSRAEAAPGFVYVPDLGERGARQALSAEESHYAARVCRARPGDSLAGSDGLGRIARLAVLETEGAVVVRVEAVSTVERGPRAHVLTGPPEGQRADWMVEKLAELGVGRWTPLECERSSWGRAAGRQQRWHRLAVAALRQSRSAHLLRVDDPVPVAHALGEIPPEVERWWADVGGETPPGRTAASAAVMIGPSTGWSDRERNLLQEGGYRRVRLATSRLRTETAAVAWAGWWAATAAGP